MFEVRETGWVVFKGLINLYKDIKIKRKHACVLEERLALVKEQLKAITVLLFLKTMTSDFMTDCYRVIGAHYNLF